MRMIIFTPVEFIEGSTSPHQTIMLADDASFHTYLRAKHEFIALESQGYCVYLPVRWDKTVQDFVANKANPKWIGMRWKFLDDLMLYKLRFAE